MEVKNENLDEMSQNYKKAWYQTDLLIKKGTAREAC